MYLIAATIRTKEGEVVTDVVLDLNKSIKRLPAPSEEVLSSCQPVLLHLTNLTSFLFNYWLTCISSIWQVTFKCKTSLYKFECYRLPLPFSSLGLLYESKKIRRAEPQHKHESSLSRYFYQIL